MLWDRQFGFLRDAGAAVPLLIMMRRTLAAPRWGVRHVISP